MVLLRFCVRCHPGFLKRFWKAGSVVAGERELLIFCRPVLFFCKLCKRCNYDKLLKSKSHFHPFDRQEKIYQNASGFSHRYCLNREFSPPTAASPGGSLVPDLEDILIKKPFSLPRVQPFPLFQGGKSHPGEKIPRLVPSSANRQDPLFFVICTWHLPSFGESRNSDRNFWHDVCLDFFCLCVYTIILHVS